MIDTEQSVDRLTDNLYDHACRLCPLSSEGAQTICMPGRGNTTARLMVVGEAPGWNEDREGVPFVGAAGQLLNKMLAEVGIDRAEVFVTNVNRCRPPANRTPTRKEQKACRPYLDAELDLVKPEVILLLGNSALQGVLGMSGILNKRGAAVEKDGRAVIPTVHPAAVLRDPSYEQFLRADLLAVKRLLDGTNEPPTTSVELINDPAKLRDATEALRMADEPVAFDVETDRLEWWHPQGRLDTVAFAGITGVADVWALEHPEQDGAADQTWWPYAELRKALHGKRLIGHNVKFDLHWLKSRGIDGYAFFDTLVAAHLLDENRSNGLKPLARTLLGADLYEKDISFGAHTGPTPLNLLAEYNGKDADYTLRLWHIFRGQLKEQPRLKRIFTHLSMPALRALCDIERAGLPVDVARLKNRAATIDATITGLETALLQYVEADSPVFDPPNFNSTKFLSEWLFTTLGLQVQATSAKTDVPSTDKATLHALRNAHPVVPLLREYRKWIKWRGTYTDNWFARLEASRTWDTPGLSRIYPNYNVTGTVTGRLSGDMQQVPRDPWIRSIFGGVPGKVIVEADYSQIELRVAAMISGDTAMIEAYRRGDDLHTLTAAAVTGKAPADVTKQDRQIAKSANFGLLYGMGWRGFRDYSALTYGVEMGDGEAQATRNAFFGRYPGLVYWHERMRRLVHAQGYVDSPIGRRRRLPQVNSSDKDMAAEAERMAINSPVQGFASDLTLMAMVLVHQILLPAKGQRIIGQVHDSLLIEANEEDAVFVAEIAKEVMEIKVPRVIRQAFGYTLPVPLVADIKIGTHWGEGT